MLIGAIKVRLEASHRAVGELLIEILPENRFGVAISFTLEVGHNVNNLIRFHIRGLIKPYKHLAMLSAKGAPKVVERAWGFIENTRARKLGNVIRVVYKSGT